MKGHMDQGQPKGHDIGRWAHINVKLHFFLMVINFGKKLVPYNDVFRWSGNDLIGNKCNLHFVLCREKSNFNMSVICP